MDINEVEDERHVLVDGEEIRVLSMSSYNLLGSSGDNIISFTQYHDLGICKVGDHLTVPALTSNALWRTKYHIGSDIEIYHGVTSLKTLG